MFSFPHAQSESPQKSFDDFLSFCEIRVVWRCDRTMALTELVYDEEELAPSTARGDSISAPPSARDGFYDVDAGPATMPADAITAIREKRERKRQEMLRWQMAGLPLDRQVAGAAPEEVSAVERFVTPTVVTDGEMAATATIVAKDDAESDDERPAGGAPPTAAEHQALCHRVQTLEQTLGNTNRELRAVVAERNELVAALEGLRATLEQRELEIRQRDAVLKRFQDREADIAEREVDVEARERAVESHLRASGTRAGPPLHRPPSRDRPEADSGFSKRRGLPPRRDSAGGDGRGVALPPLAQPPRAHSSLA